MPQAQLTGQGILQPINLNIPGFFGLNTGAGSQILGPEWCTTANNCIFDEENRLGTRPGWDTQTSTPAAGVVMRVHEYIKSDGTSEIISSTDADIFSGTSAPTTIEDVANAVTDGNIKFCNFNDEVIALGIGTGGAPLFYAGSATFDDITIVSGIAPTGKIGTAAMGRLWVCDADGHTIRYSAILDKTRWDSADGGGTIDMSKAWVHGQDVVMAIAEFAGDLVVFGKNQVIIWTDGAGSTIGISPTNLYISDTIPGTGAISQFGVANVEGDLWWMSPQGIQALSRARTDETSPKDLVTKNVETEYKAWLTSMGDEDDVTLVYSPEEGYAICNFPDVGRSLCIEGRPVNSEEGPVWRTTTWTSDLQTAAYRVSDRTTLGSLTSVVGEIMQHKDYDDDGSSYTFSYESGWLDLGEQATQYQKWVKKLTSAILVQSNTTVTYKLYYDFSSISRDNTATAEGQIGAQFNISEFTDSGAGIGYKDPTAGAGSGETEFSGGISLRTQSIPAGGGGQYIRVGVTVDNNSGNFALQQINLFARIGRIANV
jgi:hypothetical protein